MLLKGRVKDGAVWSQQRKYSWKPERGIKALEGPLKGKRSTSGGTREDNWDKEMKAMWKQMAIPGHKQWPRGRPVQKAMDRLAGNKFPSPRLSKEKPSGTACWSGDSGAAWQQVTLRC